VKIKGQITLVTQTT